MEKICIHIGLSLFAIKKLCEKQCTCSVCPLWDFCKSTNNLDTPMGWNSDAFPNVAVILDLTDGNECGNIELAPQIE